MNEEFAERFWARVDKSGEPDTCWPWTGAKSGEYGALAVLDENGAWRRRPAHRVSYELVNGAIPNGMLVCHRCDNPPCVRPDHLFLGTHKDNSDDKVAKGRNRRMKDPDPNRPRVRALRESLGATYLLKLPPELFERVKTAAKAEGISTAEWWRRAGLEKLGR
jgi:hypothetical protein